MPMPPVTIMGNQNTQSHDILRLMTWLSPAFPVGAFSYSHGLEQVVADGAIADRAALTNWLIILIENGSGWNDALLFGAAFKVHDRPDALREVAQLGTALASGKERQSEALAMGEAFLIAVAGQHDLPAGLDPAATPYAIAVGGMCGQLQIALEPSIAALLQAFCANLIGVAQRAIPLGQSDGVQILHDLEATIAEVAKRASIGSLDDLGSATFLADVASLRHEQLQPRIFRT